MERLLEEAIEAVRTAERSVRQLVEQAMKEHRFDEVPAVLSVAKQLAEIDPIRTAEMGQTGSETQDPGSSNEPGRSATSVGLPSFVREGDYLVKIGRSPSNERSYEHRAPRAALEAIADRALALQALDEGPIKAEGMSDLRQHQDSLRIPGYQLYLVLGWFKQEGFLRRHGRKGYTVKSPKTLKDDISRAWEALVDRLVEEQ